jgi:hypothetical protein
MLDLAAPLFLLLLQLPNAMQTDLLCIPPTSECFLLGYVVDICLLLFLLSSQLEGQLTLVLPTLVGTHGRRTSALTDDLVTLPAKCAELRISEVLGMRMGYIDIFIVEGRVCSVGRVQRRVGREGLGVRASDGEHD